MDWKEQIMIYYTAKTGGRGMKEVFAYVIGLGAAVMMPVIFTVLGVSIGIRPARALKSGLLVGVGFVGLGVVTALLTASLGPALKGMTELYRLNLPFFDLGWPAASRSPLRWARS